MINALSIDVEDWYQTAVFDLKVEQWDDHKSRVYCNTERIIEILSAYNVKATFFIVGWIAQRYPEVVKLISDRGHEIAAHGYYHKLVYRQSREEFKEDLIKTIVAIEKIYNKKIIGYRAPAWSIDERTLWALDMLKEQGIKYDSSIMIFKTYLYGYPSGPRYPEYIRDNMMEFPASTIRLLRKNIPFSGGFYLRLLPYSIIKHWLKKLNRNGKPGLVYIHPWEIDSQRQKYPLGMKDRFIQYYNCKTVEKKLVRLIKDFQFAPICEVLYGRN